MFLVKRSMIWNVLWIYILIYCIIQDSGVARKARSFEIFFLLGSWNDRKCHQIFSTQKVDTRWVQKFRGNCWFSNQKLPKRLKESLKLYENCYVFKRKNKFKLPWEKKVKRSWPFSTLVIFAEKMSGMCLNSIGFRKKEGCKGGGELITPNCILIKLNRIVLLMLEAKFIMGKMKNIISKIKQKIRLRIVYTPLGSSFIEWNIHSTN